jgi:hypothetical protein
MDEKTELLAARFPEDVVAWLKRVAEARGWRLSRTLRWAVRETMAREYDKAEEEHLREIAEIPDPPADALENRVSAADAFPDDQD